MIIISMLLLLRGASAVLSNHTFRHVDPTTGASLACDMCPPGTHMTSRCTVATRTQCAPCRSEHYTALWNYLPRCLYCNNICSGEQEVEAECSAVSNRRCRCKQGLYWLNDFCVRHSECDAGHGVKTTGTPQSDTECEVCPDGSFSSSSSALETCVKHSECAGGQTALLPGSIYHDTVCGTCEELARGGETLRAFVSGHFAMHRMRVAKMKKFVNRYIDRSVPRQRGPLQHQIRAWLTQAPLEELRMLPQMLRASQLSSMAEKLEKRLQEIKQENPGCSLIL